MTTQTMVQTAFLESRGSAGLVQRTYSVRIAGRSLALTAPVTLGAGSDVDVRVESPTASRRHARLVPGPRGVQLLDLDSKNGTFIGGLRVTDVLVERTTRIRLGSTELELVVQEEAVRGVARRSFGGLVGESAAMQALFGQLELVAQSDSPVLLLGESGTGKSEAARALHELSPRQRGPFVVLDCSALSEELAESELFGHVRGAFTGAERDRAGVFHRATGGTLHLEDVGALPASLQPRLLRALESRAVQPVGGTEPRAFDVRVVASAAPRLRTSGFRADLYFRLSVIELLLPPLRERRQDVRALAAHFAGQRVLPAGFFEALDDHAWPGNVRELRNLVDRALALGAPPEPLGAAGTPDEAERHRIERALTECAWNQSAAAKRLGISRGTLIARIEKYGLPRPRAR